MKQKIKRKRRNLIPTLLSYIIFGWSILLSSNNFFLVKSMRKDPRGAVMNIDITAIVRIILPLLIPSDKGIAAIEACTVAFGR